ncbi:unnamed protein product [Nippostrongylus brasiliensis]|uniref:DUF4440 domain-containing protein n=1 Tax=Nippostrongylus brasiliensis TaxID=27835 RepID=A0A0N4YG76_NIPBR|nr:unnamed protein product [Nippostrongylus brasiliensis]
METFYSSGNIDKLIEYYHPDAVSVDKGRNIAYGIQGIKQMYSKYFGAYGPTKFEVTDEKYQGTEDYLVLHCRCKMESKIQGAEDVRIVSIWKKHDGKWLVYHEEYSDAT